MGDEVLKVEPATVVCTGTPGGELKAKNQLTNGGASKVTLKIKVSHPTIQVAKPFMNIDPGQTVSMHSKLAANADPSQQYAIAIQYADAPADMGPDPPAIKTAWGSITNAKTIRLPVEIKAGEAAAGEEAPAAPEGGEGGGGE